MAHLTRREAIAVAAVLSGAGLAAARPDALLRLSVLGDEAFAPTAAGDLKRGDYDPATRVGRFGAFKYPEVAAVGSPLRDCVAEEAKRRTPDLKGGPVVTMVHGFLADPRQDVRPDAPQRTDNPHDFSFHYAAGPGPYWRHAVSWPLGLGFAPADGGAAGLAVAFGWNSTPDLLTEGLMPALAAARSRLTWADLIDVPLDLLELAAATPAIVASAKAIPVPMSVGRVVEGVRKLDDLLTAVEGPLAKLGDRLPEVYREPYRRADLAAWVLVNTLQSLAAALPTHPLDLFCHSLGSRVVVQALFQMATVAAGGGPAAADMKSLLGRVGRVVIVGGAEYAGPARQMLAAVRKAGAACPSFYNFEARRDRILGLLAERFHPVALDLRKVIGLSGLGADAPDPNWIDLQLETEPDGTHPLNAWLKPRGLAVSGAHLTGLLNHWHYFSGPENMVVYAAILRDRAAWDIPRLRREKVPEAAR
jgi:hypothetical protein